MKSWIRITSVVFVLIGGTIFFGHWSLLQFGNAFDELSAFNVANTASVASRVEIDVGQIQSTPSVITASSSVTTNNEEIATTSREVVASSSPITDDVQTATTSPEISAISATSTDLNVSFTFPKKGAELYIGCTYQISWQSSTTVDSLGLALIDAGTEKIAGPIASGLAKENNIEADSQNLNWKVGVVWPGRYYIKVLKINASKVDYKSKNFVISKMTPGISVKERANLCKGSAN